MDERWVVIVQLVPVRSKTYVTLWGDALDREVRVCIPVGQNLHSQSQGQRADKLEQL